MQKLFYSCNVQQKMLKHIFCVCVFVGILQLIAHVSVPALSLANYLSKLDPIPTTKHAPYNPNHLFYFVHMSDIHIRDTHPEDDSFLEFCNKTLPSISPAFLIITGDLTQ